MTSITFQYICLYKHIKVEGGEIKRVEKLHFMCRLFRNRLK